MRSWRIKYHTIKSFEKSVNVEGYRDDSAKNYRNKV